MKLQLSHVLLWRTAGEEKHVKLSQHGFINKTFTFQLSRFIIQTLFLIIKLLITLIEIVIPFKYTASKPHVNRIFSCMRRLHVKSFFFSQTREVESKHHDESLIKLHKCTRVGCVWKRVGSVQSFKFEKLNNICWQTDAAMYESVDYFSDIKTFVIKGCS